MIESAHELEITSEIHKEAIGLMIATGGEGGARAAGELKARIHEVRAGLEREAVRYADPRGGGIGLPGVLFKMFKHVKIRRTYQSRLEEMKRQGADVGAGLAPGPGEGGSEYDEVHAYMIKYAGQKYIDDSRARVASALAAARSELATVGTDLALALGRHEAGQVVGQFGDPYRAHLPPRERGGGNVSVHDSAYHRIAELVALRVALSARVAAIEQDSAKRIEVQGELVRGVAKLAGGKAAVAESMRAALLLSGGYFQSDPAHREIEVLERRKAEAQRKQTLLGPAGSATAREPLKREVAECDQALGQLRGEIDSRLSAGLAETVESACKGDEPSRARIAELARAQPVAFPDQFGSRLVDCQFERSALGQSILLLIEPEEKKERSLFQ